MDILIEDANLFARYLISQQAMSQKKLHKLLFYSYALYLYVNNDSEHEIKYKLFENNFKGWIHGPVYTTLYKEYRNFGYKEFYLDHKIEIPDDAIEIANMVMKFFGKYSASELESLTHSDISWLKSREGLGPLDAGKIKLDDSLIYISMANMFENE